jgi:hypothetical protein
MNKLLIAENLEDLKFVFDINILIREMIRNNIDVRKDVFLIEILNNIK